MLLHIVEFPQRKCHVLNDFGIEGFLVLKHPRFYKLLNSDSIPNVAMDLWTQFLLGDVLVNDSLGLSVQEEI